MKKRAFEAVEAEIRKEKAEARGRVGERLEGALRELEAVRREVQGLAASGCYDLAGYRGVPAEIEEKLGRYAGLRERARQLRHHLVIQREAMGLPRHDDVDRHYPMPAPLMLPMLTRGEEAR